MDGERSEEPAHAKTGTGSNLLWSGLPAGKTYMVKLETNDCGNYAMNSSVEITNFYKSPRPYLANVTEALTCSGTPALTIATLPSNATKAIYYSKSGNHYTELGRVDPSPTAFVNTSTYAVNATEAQNQFGVSYIDENGCESSILDYEIEVVPTPAPPTIEGESNVCVNQRTQAYEVRGVAQAFEWRATHGTLNTTSGRNVNVTWDESQPIFALQTRGVNKSRDNSLSCPSDYTTLQVLLKKDIEFFTLSATDNQVCPGELGEVSLESSQNGRGTYALYVDGTRSSVSGYAKHGTGSPLVWQGLPPDKTYTVKLETSDCGNYDMLGSIAIREHPQSPAPRVPDNPSRCGEGQLDIAVTVPSNARQVLYYRRSGSNYTQLHRTRATVSDAIGTAEYAVTATPTRNQFGTNYIDVNGCPSLFANYSVAIVPIPPAPIITGTSNVCVDAETQVYTANGTGTRYEWRATHGELSATTGGSLSVDWDESQSSGWQVEARAVNVVGERTCTGSYTVYPVRLKKDVTRFQLIGATQVCDGGLGEVRLANSQNGRGTYSLYIDDNRSTAAGHAKPGTGSPLVWSGLSPDKTYTVKLETSDCEDYDMLGGVQITEFSKSAAPSVPDDLSRCGNGDIAVAVTVPPDAQKVTYYSNSGSEYTALGERVIEGSGATVSTEYSVNATSTQNQFGVNFIDANGCASLFADYQVTILTVPPTSEVIRQSYCKVSREVDLLTLLSDRSGQFNPANGLYNSHFINPSNLSVGEHTFNYGVRNSSGCMSVSDVVVTIKASPSIPTLNEVYNVCAEDGTVTARIDNPVEGFTYHWMSGSGSTLGEGTSLALPTTSSYTFQVTAENSAGCTTQSAVSRVNNRSMSGTITATPSPGLVTGRPVQFSTTIEADRYRWTFTGGYQSTQQNPVIYFYEKDRHINATLTANNQWCEKVLKLEDKLYIRDTDNLLSDAEDMQVPQRIKVTHNATLFSLYPNPVVDADVVHLQFTSIASEKLYYRLYTLQDIIQAEGALDVQEGENTLPITVSEVPKGVYVVQIRAAQLGDKPSYILAIKQ